LDFSSATAHQAFCGTVLNAVDRLPHPIHRVAFAVFPVPDDASQFQIELHNRTELRIGVDKGANFAEDIHRADFFVTDTTLLSRQTVLNNLPQGFISWKRIFSHAQIIEYQAYITCRLSNVCSHAIVIDGFDEASRNEAAIVNCLLISLSFSYAAS